MTFAQSLEAATKSAVCGWLANGGNVAAANWIVKGSRTPWTAVAGGVAALGLLAVNYACNYDPNTGPVPAAPPGCWEVSGGWATLYAYDNGVKGGFTSTNIKRVVSCLPTTTQPPNGTQYELTYIHSTTGATTKAYFTNTATRTHKLEVAQGTCVAQSPTSPVPYEPYTYVDQTTNCTFVVEHEAFVMDDSGNVIPVVKISPGAQALASGGIIGGCNFGPVIYAPGGGGGGGIYTPWVPGTDDPDGKPWWWDLVMGASGRLIGAGIEELLRRLFEEKAPATIYRLTSVCETNEQGEALDLFREVPIPQLPILQGLVARMDAMDDLMQGLKDFRQPICKDAPPSGINYSVQFRSTVKSPYGKERLRKELRYRDQGDAGLIAHRDHWIGFEWESGPWMVISTGLPWGKPRVWASSPEEGQRVLAHAAAISSVNLNDARHKWIVREVQNDRYGPRLKMVVHRDVHGVHWISTRNGSNGLPEAALDLSSDINVGD